ncbi:MAG: N-acetyltransferase [Piscinibacter sp.]|uniref:GNAT family N-acetyltransferase n=1 Tax=Piscinibacter sp. TaxID=1903157 RepID=UPI00258F0342|nr:GNAT family N-acetyltransferase [Piscinibacter sp.]MCW5662722.1 N-acetyltransferase [Piscinibacter sp.]
MTPTIEHDAHIGRFQTRVHGHLCVCDYRLRDGVMVITHTEVAPELEGQGLAAELVRAALGHARTQGLKVRPLCSYVQAYMRRHPETQDLLAGPV